MAFQTSLLLLLLPLLFLVLVLLLLLLFDFIALSFSFLFLPLFLLLRSVHKCGVWRFNIYMKTDAVAMTRRRHPSQITRDTAERINL